MTILLDILIVTLALVAAYCVGRSDEARRRDRPAEPKWYSQGPGAFEAGQKVLREAVADALPDVRYEVLLNDWGPEHGEMRWRWTIWEADRAVDAVLYGLDAKNPGMLDPFMLGNAATRMLAEAQALAWIAAHPLHDDAQHEFVIS